MKTFMKMDQGQFGSSKGEFPVKDQAAMAQMQ
jgi:hypothetical protein